MLAEPNAGWENFEACLRTPGGRLLPGGYNTGTIHDPQFQSNHGFSSPRAVLRWWARTQRPSFGRRLLCWGCVEDPDFPTEVRHFWDVRGVHYDRDHYVAIRDSGQDLPVP